MQFGSLWPTSHQVCAVRELCSQVPWMGSLFSSAWLYYHLDLQIGSTKLLRHIEPWLV